MRCRIVLVRLRVGVRVGARVRVRVRVRVRIRARVRVRVRWPNLAARVELRPAGAPRHLEHLG